MLIQQHHYQARPAGNPTSRMNGRENHIVKDNGTVIIANNHSVYQVDGKFIPE